jgi:diguanylate cyclase (GGDEF)-like protein
VDETRWHSVLVDHEGTLWAVGEHHVVVLPRGATRFVERNRPDPDPNSVYRQISAAIDRAGRILTVTDEGVARWEGNRWRMIGRANGLDSGHISSMLIDADGDLWMATLGRGLYHWVGYEDWEAWSDPQGLPSATVWSIVASGGQRVIAGTEKGPAWIDLSSGAAGPFFAGQKWTYGQIIGMGYNHDGSVWTITVSGDLLRIDPQTVRFEAIVRVPGLIEGAMQGRDGSAYFFSEEGVYAFPAINGRENPVRVDSANAQLGQYRLADAGCFAADGTAWLLSGNRLLHGINGRWSLPPIDGLPKMKESLVALTCAADGALWATGAESGTWRLTPEAGRLRAWQLTLPAELATMSPVSILADRRGWIWMGTDGGLVVWNGREWRHLTQESGLIWNDTNQSALTEGSDGSLWIGTSGGLAHMLHPERVFGPVPLTVSLTEFERGAMNYTGARQITLPWAGPPLQFRVSSPTMRNRSELILKIRMAGLQAEWAEIPDGIATYSRLSPGSYTFMAMACNPGLNACSETVNVDIKILPPWWRTYWFFALCTLAFLALLIAINQIYERHLLARSRELERQVGERTRELELSREQLHIQATHDGLTGLLNRTAILQTLTQEMERARREGQTVVVALIDLDHFKRINDRYGHLAGDEALRCFSSAVGTAIRAYDHAGRYGGEEFLVVLTQIPRDAIEQRLAGLHQGITNLQIHAQGSEFEVNCSVGATVFDPLQGVAGVESLLAIADLSLYAAKAAGRNRVIFRSPVSASSEREVQPQLSSTH